MALFRQNPSSKHSSSVDDVSDISSSGEAMDGFMLESTHSSEGGGKTVLTMLVWVESCKIWV